MNAINQQNRIEKTIWKEDMPFDATKQTKNHLLKLNMNYQTWN